MVNDFQIIVNGLLMGLIIAGTPLISSVESMQNHVWYIFNGNEMSNSSISKVILSAALALICICVVQGYWLSNSFDQSQKAFEEKVHITLRNVAKQISELQQVQLPSYDLINQMSQNYYLVNIRDAIDANNLEFYIKKELEHVGLHTDFEYGIYDCDTDQMVYGNYVSSNEWSLTNPPTPSSFEIPTQTDYVYYFGIRFPNHKGYMLKNQWLPILFTIILILAALFFAYATFEILRQKNLADLQKDFINNMTHEFNTPLSSIKISSEVFLKDPIVQQDERLRTYAGIINTQATRLSVQVERVLQIADMNSSKIILNQKHLDLHKVVTGIVDQLKSRTEEMGATLSIEANGHNFKVFADGHHLSNVLTNLIDNALKYTKGLAEVTIRIVENAHTVTLLVLDNGIGIEEKYLSLINQKFFRVPTGNRHNTKGFGLGLHYVKQIVDAHGWIMHIKSTPHIGTQISLEMSASSGKI